MTFDMTMDLDNNDTITIATLQDKKKKLRGKLWEWKNNS